MVQYTPNTDRRETLKTKGTEICTVARFKKGPAVDPVENRNRLILSCFIGAPRKRSHGKGGRRVRGRAGTNTLPIRRRTLGSPPFLLKTNRCP